MAVIDRPQVLVIRAGGVLMRWTPDAMSIGVTPHRRRKRWGVAMGNASACAAHGKSEPATHGLMNVSIAVSSKFFGVETPTIIRIAFFAICLSQSA
jgi:hypothetical protein